MGVEKRHSHVKFTKTIRLGKNTDLDNATAGQVEVGSLRDTGVFIERWNGASWEIIGPFNNSSDVDFGDTPYTVVPADNRIYIDTTNGNVVINLISLSIAPEKGIHVQKIDSRSNTVTITADGSDTINGAATKVILSQDVDHELFPTSSEWRLS